MARSVSEQSRAIQVELYDTPVKDVVITHVLDDLVVAVLVIEVLAIDKAS